MTSDQKGPHGDYRDDYEQYRPDRQEKANVSSKTKMHPNANRKVIFNCFWQSGCSDSTRCNAHGSCVAATQAGGATFAQQMEPNTRPLSHMEILSAVAHHAREIVRLTAVLPVKCTPDETAARPIPHGVVYDKPGWLCSICGFWNNIRDNHCAGVHLESDGASEETAAPHADPFKRCQHDLQKPGTTIVVSGPYDCRCMCCTQEWHLPPVKSPTIPWVGQRTPKAGDICQACGNTWMPMPGNTLFHTCQFPSRAALNGSEKP